MFIISKIAESTHNEFGMTLGKKHKLSNLAKSAFKVFLECSKLFL